MSCPSQFSSRNKTAFLAALDYIAAANREPTPQEAAFLFSALGAMARGDERSAERAIEPFRRQIVGELGHSAIGGHSSLANRSSRAGAGGAAG